MKRSEWKQMIRAEFPGYPEEGIADQMRIAQQTREQALATMTPDEYWLNNVYDATVYRFKTSPLVPSVHLSVRRHDGEIVRDWRHLQWIKNDVLGENVEAFEIFPAEKRLVDTINAYHLWAFPAGYRIPLPAAIGRGRTVANEATLPNTKQRAFE